MEKFMTFGEKIDEKIEVDELSTKEYIPTRKQEIILDNIIKTIESFISSKSLNSCKFTACSKTILANSFLFIYIIPKAIIFILSKVFKVKLSL